MSMQLGELSGEAVKWKMREQKTKSSCRPDGCNSASPLLGGTEGRGRRALLWTTAAKALSSALLLHSSDYSRCGRTLLQLNWRRLPLRAVYQGGKHHALSVGRTAKLG